MPLDDVLNVSGFLFQLIGIATAAVGLIDTWREFGPADEPFLAPVSRAARRAAQYAVALARRVLRRPRDVRVVAGSASFQMGQSMRGRGRVQFRELPTGVDVTAALAELDERTRILSTRMADATDRLDDDAEAVREAVTTLGGRVTDEVTRLDTQTRSVAAGGVRLEAAGIFSVAVGTALQAIATAIG